jgi:hypothetical protein
MTRLQSFAEKSPQNLGIQEVRVQIPYPAGIFFRPQLERAGTQIATVNAPTMTVWGPFCRNP